MTVQVLNATGTQGLAARTTSRLRALGWAAVTAGNAPPASRTTIRYPPGQQPAARALAGRLTGPVQLTLDPAGRASTLRLVLGTSYQGVREATQPPTTTPQPSTTATPATAGAPARAFDPRPC